VQQLQREQGLAADGQAGPLTLMRLNRLLQSDEPHLLAQPDADASRSPARSTP